jgi:hypothetical protein
MSRAPIAFTTIFQGNLYIFWFSGGFTEKVTGGARTTVECGRLEPETEKSALSSVEHGF